MKHRVTLVFLAFFFALFLFSLTTSAKAQVAENSALFKTVMTLDSQLFNEGFNHCRLDVTARLSDENLQFFHDKSGMQNRAEFLLAMKNNVCGNPEGRPVRTLLAGSTEIFALENNGVLYGAVQQGEHRFHLKGSDTEKAGYTDAKFTHVWLLKNGKWRLKSAISFDHQQKFGKMATAAPVKKAEPKPYTIYDLTLLGHSLRLDYRAMLD